MDVRLGERRVNLVYFLKKFKPVFLELFYIFVAGRISADNFSIGIQSCFNFKVFLNAL